MLSAAGPIADGERSMLIAVALVTLIVVIPVFVFVPWIIWRYRRSDPKGDYAPTWDFSAKLEWLAWGVPVLIVLALSVLLWQRAHALDPYREMAGPGKPVEVEVVGLDWKWLFIYPEQGVATVNQMVIPAGRPVNLKLTSGSVMQSFHVPQLAGQIYAMGGMTTRLSLLADRPGTYLGRNTQYNGNGFARQQFDVVAVPKGDFAKWVADHRGGETLDKATFAQLARQSVPDKPIYYGSVAPNMFQYILRRSVEAPPPLGDSPGFNPKGAVQ